MRLTDVMSLPEYHGPESMKAPRGPIADVYGSADCDRCGTWVSRELIDARTGSGSRTRKDAVDA